jgi:hypothetical protein
MQFELHVDVSTIVTVVVLPILVGALSACTVLDNGRSALVLAVLPATTPPASTAPPTPVVHDGSELKHHIAEFHVDVSTIVIAVALLILVGALSACKVLGTGRNTLVLANPPKDSNYEGDEFKHLIATPSKMRLIGLQGKRPHEGWEKFKNERLGGADVNVASIGINVRDQTNTPPLELSNIETAIATADDVTKILADNKLTQQQKDALLTQFRDNFRSMPETYSRLVSQGVDEKGNPIYYYYPQITIDLAGTLNTAETLDRFDFIAAAIRIPSAIDATFINFSPKAADLFDFTLGQLKQTASAKASANTSNKVTTNATTGNNSTGAPGRGVSAGGELGYGGSVDFTLTDELTRDIKSSLEARSAGIMQNGKLFLVQLRGNEQKRISGTYSFNAMLQVPSTVERSKIGAMTIWTSKPNVESIKAQVRIVGIVRHVVKPGKTCSIVKRVPEPLNDETYHQVVLHDLEVPLWKFSNIQIAKISTDWNLIVYSNIDGASFIVVDETDGKKLAHGTGREAHLTVEANNTVKIVFTPVIVGGDKPVVLKAPDVNGITPGKNAIASGSYIP